MGSNSKRFLAFTESGTHWAGGITDTLTSFGVMKFFLLFMIALSFFALMMNKNTISFTSFLNMLTNLKQIPFEWVDDFNDAVENITFFTSTSLGNSGNLLNIGSLFVKVLLAPINLLLYLVVALANALFGVFQILQWFFIGISV